jgi:CHAT domain-containing protein
MKRFLLLISLLLIDYFYFGGNAQSPPPYVEILHRAEQFYNAENPTGHTDSLAYQLYSQAIQLLEKDHANDSLLIDAYTKAAILKQMKGDDPVAIGLFRLALKVADNNRSLSDSVRFFPLLYCGSSYYTLYQFDSASYYYQQAEKVTEKFPRVPERERLYNKIGTLFYEEGNFHQSLNYFTKALSLLDTTNTANNFLMVNYYNNIALTYRKLGRYEEALNTYRSLLPYRINEDGLMHNIATIYLDLQQPEKALQYLHAVKKPGQQQYNNLAVAHLQLNHQDSVSFYLQKAFSSRVHSFKTAVNGLSWYYLGRLQEKQEQYEQALKTYHRAIIEMDPDFNNPDLAGNPTQFNGMHSFSDLFNALTAKATIQRKLYLTTKQVSFLEQSLQTWETALLLARTVQQGYEADESRLFLNHNLQPASEQAAATALNLYEAKPEKRTLEKIFQLAETSKAAVLQIRLQQSSAATLPGMPLALLEKQKTQQILLGRLQVQYERGTDTAMLASLQQQVRDQEILLSEVNQQLNNNPKYAAARSVNATLDIAALQKELPENMGMLAYYLIHDRWLAFALTKDSLSLELLRENGTVTQALNVMRAQLSSPALSATQLMAPAATLHQWCVQPLLPHLQGIKRLVIIPDHDLQYLPFEVLAPENGKTLQEYFAISYNYSAVFFGTPVKKQGAVSRQLGLAPFGGRKPAYPGDLLPLPASAEEIKPIKGDKLVDSAATKQAFTKNASSYSSIHLATHAAANDHDPENSFIAFYPSGTDTNYKLYQPEIYNLDLQQTQLVILSACETGRGQFVHGEGMMSLSRAFSYAGCKSVITSLWKADDASTAYITKRLHHYLQSGKPKDIALQQAKLDYLNDGSIPGRMKTPAYWAHLVLIGDPAPLYASSFSIWWIITGAAVFAGLAVVIYRRKKQG